MIVRVCTKGHVNLFSDNEAAQQALEGAPPLTPLFCRRRVSHSGHYHPCWCETRGLSAAERAVWYLLEQEDELPGLSWRELERWIAVQDGGIAPKGDLDLT